MVILDRACVSDPFLDYKSPVRLWIVQVIDALVNHFLGEVGIGGIGSKFGTSVRYGEFVPPKLLKHFLPRNWRMLG